MTVAELLTTTTLASVATLTVFLWWHWAEVSPAWIRTRPWAVLAWSVVAALGAVIPSAWLQEQMPELPNWAEHEFDMILQNRWGYLVIGLLVPFTEELVFRGAILRRLLADSRMPPAVRKQCVPDRLLYRYSYVPAACKCRLRSG